MSDDNGGKWYGSSNVIRTLFWIIFTIVVGFGGIWGTYVFTKAEGADVKAERANRQNDVQDEQIRTVREDLKDIKADQKEILRRLPR